MPTRDMLTDFDRFRQIASFNTVKLKTVDSRYVDKVYFRQNNDYKIINIPNLTSPRSVLSSPNPAGPLGKEKICSALSKIYLSANRESA